MRIVVLVSLVILALAAFAGPQAAPQAAPQEAPQVSLPVATPVSPAAAQPFLGTWDIPISQGEGRPTRNCWLELKLDGQMLTGRYLSGGGSPGAIEGTVENGELKFWGRRRTPQGGQGGGQGAPGTPPAQGAQGTPPAQGAQAQGARGGGQGQRAPQAPQIQSAVIKDGKLVGKITQGERVTEWVGVRPPKWPDTPPARKAGTPVLLFNGKDLTGWHPQAAASANRPYNPSPLGWIVADGALYNPNAPASANIVSDQKFMDFKLEVEFKVEDHTNSGIFLRGRHEIQVENDFGKPLGILTHGAIYGHIPPSVEPSLPVGEWQKMEATLIGNRVTIIMNGKKIHDNVVIPGITGGALDTNEGEPGPIMLQGDHSVVHYRKVVVTPLI